MYLLLLGDADSLCFIDETITDFLKFTTAAVVIEHVVVVCLNLVGHAFDFGGWFFFSLNNFLADLLLIFGEILSMLLELELLDHVQLVH